MADKETEAEWAQMRKVETERQKARKAVQLEQEKHGKVNLAYLDPAATKIKGWSSNPNVILANASRMADKSFILMLGGVLLSILGTAGNMVASVFNLGLAGVVLAIPGAVGGLCMGAAGLMAAAVIGCEIYFKAKNGRSFSVAFPTSLGTIVVGVLYICLKTMIL